MIAVRAESALEKEADIMPSIKQIPAIGDIIEDAEEFGRLCLGDIVISLERANEQSIEYGHPFNREVGFLTVHSMLHLLGSDHMEETEEKEMFEYQEQILKSIGLTR